MRLEEDVPGCLVSDQNYLTLANSNAGTCHTQSCPLKHDYSHEERDLLCEYLIFSEERRQKAVANNYAASHNSMVEEF